MQIRLGWLLRWTLRLAGALFLFLLVGGAGLWWHFRRSLPPLEGALSLAGLSAPVTIERDAQGVPTIHAENRLDAARALGFLHAQDRFFGMDLNRRFGAGELSEIVGSVAVGYDQSLRFFPGRRLAEEGFARMPEEDRRLLEAYTEGVNAGLRSLRAEPPEYVLPGIEAKPWKPEDCLLVGLNMFYNLQDSRADVDIARAYLRDHLPAEVADYILRRHPRSDAPLDGSTGPAWDLPVEAWARAIAAAEPAPASTEAAAEPSPTPGSNAWAVGRAATTDGRAILANDMHLGLQVPHVWYRVSQRFRDADGRPVQLDGPTLPGLPVTIVGSNGHVAWGFTNSYTDQTDAVALELDPQDPNRYRGPDGWIHFRVRTETIRVAFGKPVNQSVKETIWGPVRTGFDGQLFAVQWAGATVPRWNMRLDRLAGAQTLEEAIAIAHAAVVPTQNFVVADASGEVAWTLIGGVPERPAGTGFFPLTAESAGEGWSGRQPSEAIPVVRTPDGDRIWTANQRIVGGDALARIGDGGYDVGWRASTIRDGLRSGPIDEASMFALQGSVEATYLRRWQELFLRTLDDEAIAADPARAAYRELLAGWSGRADADSLAFVHLRAARGTIYFQLRNHLGKPLGPDRASLLSPSAGTDFGEIAFDCVATPHEALTPPPYPSMRALVLSTLDAVRAKLAKTEPWGELNALEMRHAVLGPIPIVGDWFSMPRTPQPGEGLTVRVLRPGFGSSERMVVAPGHEDEGFYHQPGGASGHFLSPYFDAGHEDWVEMRPSPFLPGPAVHTLRLLPASP